MLMLVRVQLLNLWTRLAWNGLRGGGVLPIANEVVCVCGCQASFVVTVVKVIRLHSIEFVTMTVR